ncbi:hypothetical protein JB92DRAFT_3145277 [Gautieria morchelliformis]|nr:hypothetical protein JB92DRAFT_3145277 [Gautieria morchelliformis]
MASSTVTSPTPKEQHNPHPYPIKTSHTGLLTRSNSSKAHGSWSKHHYTPVAPSPSAVVFDPPQSSPSPARRHAKSSSHVQPAHASPSNKSHKYDSPRASDRGASMSQSESKYSRSWVGRNSEGEKVDLPRHPYLWTPAQLGNYLSSELCGSDGEPLDSDVVNNVVDFIQQRKIGGRAFLNLDQEDFHGMEGVNSVWSNALWDASCTLRQGLAPYRPSRISSSTYRRGRVRGVVDLFERSASESSDVGDDEAHNSSPVMSVPRTRKYPRQTRTQKSESEGEPGQSNIGRSGPSHLHGNTITRGDPEVLLNESSVMDVGTSAVHDVVHDMNPQTPSTVQVGLDANEHTTRPPASGDINDNLAVVLPPQSGTPVDLVLAPDEFHYADSPGPDLPDEPIPSDHQEVAIASILPREDSEPTMAELYEQTYGALPPSHREHPVPLPSEDTSDEEAQGETVKLVAAAASTSDQPPTALRPIVQRRAASPPPSLRRLFAGSRMLQAASDTEQQNVYVLPTRDELATGTLNAMKERLAIVERRLADMELRDAEANTSKDVFPHRPKRARKACVPVEADPDDFDLEVHSSRPSEALRTWQSAYILMAGATTGVSIVLIPMLLRHFWSR